MESRIAVCAVAVSLLSPLGTVAQAGVITGLYRTGVDDSGTALAVGTVDPHYSLNGGDAFVQTPQVTGDPSTTWV